MQSSSGRAGVAALDDSEHATLLTAAAAEAPPQWTKALLRCAAALREAIEADPTLAPLRLSTRRLLRIARHLHAAAAATTPPPASSHTTQDEAVSAALGRELGATLALLPRPTQRSIDELVGRTLRASGLPTVPLLPPRYGAASASVGAVASSGGGGGGGGERERQRTAEEKARLIKQLENSAVQLRTASMYGYSNASGEAQLDAEVRRLRSHEAKAAEAAQAKRRDAAIAQVSREARDGGGAGGAGGLAASAARVKIGASEVAIDGVIAKRRVPSVPSLVPRVTFYEVTRHVNVLREMLRDWTLGHHLLLIGNQVS